MLEDPLVCHSKAMVFTQSTLNMVTLSRIATIAKKDLWVAKSH